MKYMGSKRRIAKHILPIMLAEAKTNGVTKWIEPFVGGGNMIDKVPNTFKRIGFDLNPHTIQALKDIRDHASDLPEIFNNEQRKYVRDLPYGVHLESWASIVTSFGADLKGGWAREKKSDDSTFCLLGKRNAAKQSPNIQGVIFKCRDYRKLYFKNSIIYCDPPYLGTSGYKTGTFNHEEFYDWCRELAKDNIVFVSEYTAPEDFEEVWRGRIKTNFSSTRKSATHNAVEKLFRVKPL